MLRAGPQPGGAVCGLPLTPHHGFGQLPSSAASALLPRGYCHTRTVLAGGKQSEAAIPRLSQPGVARAQRQARGRGARLHGEKHEELLPGSAPVPLSLCQQLFHTFYLRGRFHPRILQHPPCPHSRIGLAGACRAGAVGPHGVASGSPGTSSAGDTMRINHSLSETLPYFSSILICVLAPGKQDGDVFLPRIPQD